MSTQRIGKPAVVIALSLAAAGWNDLAIGQTAGQSGQAYGTGSNAVNRGTQNQAQTAVRHVDAAVDAIHKMEAESGMDKLLQQAKGVFIVPSFGRAALGVGGAGGPGVLLVKHGDSWSDPAFYTVGALNVGAQAGIQAGSVALVLNSDKAVNNFMRNNKFSVDANAGLTIFNWSKEAQRSAGRGDVVAWTDTKGLFGDLAVGISDIHYDARETSAYYHQKVAAQDVINGMVSNPQAGTLKQALAAATSATSSGSSGSSTMESGSGSRDNTSRQPSQK
jgi:lipid-binding SYLF domain-containing protein